MDDARHRLDEIADEHDLRELLLLYCRGVDRRDMALLRSVFHEDAGIDYGAAFYAGPVAGFLANVPAALSSFGITQHHITNSVFRCAGDTAQGESYFIAYHLLKLPGQGMYIAGGRYLDHFARRGGVWRISHRTAVRDWDMPEGNITGPLAGQSGPSDPSYAVLASFQNLLPG